MSKLGLRKSLFNESVDLDKKDDYMTDLTNHKSWVSEYLYKIADMLKDRADHHDEDKLNEPLASVYEQLHNDLLEVDYGTDEYTQIVQSDKYKDVIGLHQKNNRHHTEHYEDGVAGMNLIDVIEMIVDWYSASKRSDEGTSFSDGCQINMEHKSIDGLAKDWITNTALELMDL